MEKVKFQRSFAMLEARVPEEGRKIQLSSPFWSAFAGALFAGLITHGMALFNKLSWHDDIFSLFMTGTTIQLGRWMLYVIVEMEKWFYGNGHFSIPVVNGVFSLLCIGLSAGMIAKYFHIRSRKLSVLMGALMAIFPVVTSLFSFMFTVHYYMLALVMITGGGILICADGAWWKKVIGVLLCGCSVGIYQAFLPVLLMLVLMDQIMFLIRREESTGIWARRLLIRVICIAGVMAVYVAGNRYFLWIKDLQLDSYLGISDMGTASLGEYWQRICTAYREFFFLTHNTLWDMYPQAVYNMYRLMLCLDALLGGIWILRCWKKSPIRALLLAAMLILVPLGCNFIFVMSEEIHSLMMYGEVMQIVLLACLTDWTEFRTDSWHRLLSLGTAGVMAVSGVMYFRYDNQCYLKAVLQQQEAISWNTTLVTRIESTPGFRDELPVAFLNRREMRDQNLYNLEEFDFLTLGTYDSNIQEYLNNWAWEAFLARWCGFEPEIVVPGTVESWPEVQDMPSYPDDGSIRVIRDVIVVKF